MNNDGITLSELAELLKKDRSIRRFKENIRIGKETVESLIALTRFCASGRNLQPLKYIAIVDEQQCETIFPLLKWAGYLTEWAGPQAGERPAAYIIQGLDTRITNNCLCDEGIHLQAITMGAATLNVGACIIKSFNAAKLRELFNLPEWFVPCYIVALGYPSETVVLEDLSSRGEDSIKYYRTENGIHHVPKRSVEEIIMAL